MGMLHNPLSLI